MRTEQQIVEEAEKAERAGALVGDPAAAYARDAVDVIVRGQSADDHARRDALARRIGLVTPPLLELLGHHGTFQAFIVARDQVEILAAAEWTGRYAQAFAQDPEARVYRLLFGLVLAALSASAGRHWLRSSALAFVFQLIRTGEAIAALRDEEGREPGPIEVVTIQ